MPNVCFGISFGTDGVVISSSTTRGRQDVVADDSGARVTPAWVAYANGECLTGNAAKTAFVRHARHTVTSLPVLVAQNAAELVPQLKYTCEVEVSEDGKVTLPTLDSDVPEGSDAFGKPVEPAAAMTAVLEKVKQLLVNAAGPNEVASVVVAVPRYCDFSMMLRIVRDSHVVPPTAAVRVVADDAATALLAVPELHAPQDGEDHQPPAAHRVAVLDWGAHCLNVAVLEQHGGTFTHVANARSFKVGGAAFDKALAKSVADQFQKKTRCDPSDDARAMRKLVAAVEMAKLALGSSMTAPVAVEAFFNGIDLKEPLTKIKADMTLDGLGVLAVLKQLLADAIAEAGESTQEITHVVVAGGMTRFPRAKVLVKSAIEGALPKAQIVDSVAGSEATATGACIAAQAVQQGHNDGIAKRPTLPTLAFDLVTATKEGISAAAKGDFVVLVRQGAPLPVTLKLNLSNDGALPLGMHKAGQEAVQWLGTSKIAKGDATVTVEADGSMVVEQGDNKLESYTPGF